MQKNSVSRKHRHSRLSSAIGGAMLLAAAAVLPTVTASAFTQTVVVLDVDVREVARGYRASDLVGAAVVNSVGETIGSVDDLIVDREQVLFAILEVGGFLGVGGFLVAIPYQALAISADGSTITFAQGSRAELEQLPEFEYEAD